MALTYTLVRECLNNVEGVAGRWQIEGGTVMQKGKHVANYSSVKRVSCGTMEQNTAMLWIQACRRACTTCTATRAILPARSSTSTQSGRTVASSSNTPMTISKASS